MRPALPILYSFRRCPYAIRARLALAISEQTYEHREVVLRDKPPELLLASPKGTVPVLVLPEGQVIDESLEIMLWALQRHDPCNWLNVESEPTKALIAQCDGPFKQSLDGYKYPISETTGIDSRDQASTFAEQLNQGLLSRPYLCGASMTLADAAIVPFVRQFAAVNAAWFEQQAWPALQDWLKHITQTALFTRVIEKKPTWKS